MSGLGAFIWKIAVALYLFATGVMGMTKGGDLSVIFGVIGQGNSILVVIAGVIALIAGVCIILEMLNVSISFLDTLILIIAIIWVVFTILMVIVLIGNFDWAPLANVAVYVMVSASLLIASKKFG
ncbi:MAG: hypothetical protein FWD47_05195 [Treponema sp.]|nr:hypothetical protein [Treponema sp.]